MPSFETQIQQNSFTGQLTTASASGSVVPTSNRPSATQQQAEVTGADTFVASDGRRVTVVHGAAGPSLVDQSGQRIEANGRNFGQQLSDMGLSTTQINELAGRAAEAQRQAHEQAVAQTGSIEIQRAAVGGVGPGGGQQAAALTKNAPTIAAKAEAQRSAIIEKVNIEHGGDLASALKAGVARESQLRGIYGPAAVREAKHSLAVEAETKRITAIQQQKVDTFNAKAKDVAARVKRSGTLGDALMASGSDRVSINEAQTYLMNADGSKLSQKDIHNALVNSGRATGKRFEARTIAAAKAASQETTARLASESANRKAVDIARKLAPYETTKPPKAGVSSPLTYNVGLAIATGAITESEAQNVFGDAAAAKADAQAKTLNAAANAGYYADAKLVPASLKSALTKRRALMLRSVQTLSNAGEKQGIDQLEADIARINDFLTNGGPIPDATVAGIDAQLVTLRGQLADTENQLRVAPHGPNETTPPYAPSGDTMLEQQAASLQQQISALLAQRRDAVSRAVTNPTPQFQTTKLEQAYEYTKDNPGEVVGEVAKQAAIAVATGYVVGKAIEAAAATLPRVTTVVNAARPGLVDLLKSERGSFSFTRTATQDSQVARIVGDINEAIAVQARQANIERSKQAFADIARALDKTTSARLTDASAKAFHGDAGELRSVVSYLRTQGNAAAADKIDTAYAAFQQAEALDRAAAAQRALTALRTNDSIDANVRKDLSDSLTKLTTDLHQAATAAATARRSSTSVGPAPVIAVRSASVPSDRTTTKRKAIPLERSAVTAATSPSSEPTPNSKPSPNVEPAPTPLPAPTPETQPSERTQPKTSTSTRTRNEFKQQERAKAPELRLPNNQRLPQGHYPWVVSFVDGFTLWRVDLLNGRTVHRHSNVYGSPYETFRIESTTKQEPRDHRYDLGVFDLRVTHRRVYFERNTATKPRKVNRNPFSGRRMALRR
jgi:hypothetical protein